MPTKFKKGDLVSVYNYTVTGKRFKEGIATVIQKENDPVLRRLPSINDEDYYIVRFVGDRGHYSRNLIESELVK